MADDGVRLVKPGTNYEGAQGVTYDAGVSRLKAEALVDLAKAFQ